MFKEKVIHNQEKLKTFLESVGLKKPEGLDYSVGIYYGEKLVGTGSIKGNTLQGIGINCNYQNEGILGKIITHLMKKSLEMGMEEIFVYTKPDRIINFTSYGFKVVAKGQYAALLEWTQKGIEKYKEKIKVLGVDGIQNSSSIVMNGNPFTLGHLYLVKKAAAESTHLYIFVVEEEASIFPFNVRYRLIKEATENLDNVTVIPGGQYIISSLTFPSYFTRDEDLVKAHVDLDLEVFCRHIAPVLNITKRYVGTEPYCAVTKEYNEAMKKKLIKCSIEVVEVERESVGDDIISASKVRELIRLGRIEETKKYLPETTYNFIKSKEAEDIIEKIKESKSRH